MSRSWVRLGCLLVLGAVSGCGSGAPTDQDIESAIRSHYSSQITTLLTDHPGQAIQVREVRVINRGSADDGLYPVRVLVKGTSAPTMRLGGPPPQPYQVERDFNLYYFDPSEWKEAGWKVVDGKPTSLR